MEKYSQPIDFFLLIPYYNNREGLVQSIRSVIYNSEKCVILVIDDGSAEPLDADALILETNTTYAVEIRRLPVNRGITAALNEGLRWLAKQKLHQYKYIARLDCGDICTKDRFSKQVQFLNTHAATDLLGSWCTFEDPQTGSAYLYKTPVRPERIFRGMYFRNIFIHPTVMYRAAMMKRQFYPVEFPHAEDYGLFYRLMLNANYAILPENLVACKLESSGLSLSNRREQLKSRMEVVKRFGRSKLLIALGVLKVQLLLIIPYKMVWQLKLWLYRTVEQEETKAFVNH